MGWLNVDINMDLVEHKYKQILVGKFFIKGRFSKEIHLGLTLYVVGFSILDSGP